MKLYSKIIFLSLTLSILISCSASDNNATSNPSNYEQYGESFTAMPKSEDAIIYQVNIRAFSQQGTLNGVKAKLNDIKDLGANVIYLMPIYPVGTLNSAGGLGSPYAVKDYKAVNPDFGTLEDLRSLVTEAHNMGMAVVLDWVANHTAWDNAWITEHPDWYQHDPESGAIIIPPGTNYNDVAQLNFDNNDMRAAMIDAMSYWVYNANIDGFRCDYADAVPQSFWTDAIATVRAIKKDQSLLMLAEGSRVHHFYEGFDYTFGFGYFDALKKVYSENKPATTLQDANASEYANNYNNAYKIVRYTSNHDVNLSDGTPIELFHGTKGSVAAFVVAAYMQSVPMIYNAQEIGYASRLGVFTRTPIDWNMADATVLAEYKKIIAFRKSSNAIKTGTYKGFSAANVSAFTMETATEKVMVISNMTNTTANYIMPASLTTTAWKDAFTDVAMPATNEIILMPYQYLVLKN
ncbi:MAG: alpha-amylase family glycosyl hydrolase [Flavobacterium sp.]|nr:alpha-amylase family glycosyl hydrolase [Flavobacterium sp.]